MAIWSFIGRLIALKGRTQMQLFFLLGASENSKRFRYARRKSWGKGI